MHVLVCALATSGLGPLAASVAAVPKGMCLNTVAQTAPVKKKKKYMCVGTLGMLMLPLTHQWKRRVSIHAFLIIIIIWVAEMVYGVHACTCVCR